MFKLEEEQQNKTIQATIFVELEKLYKAHPKNIWIRSVINQDRHFIMRKMINDEYFNVLTKFKTKSITWIQATDEFLNTYNAFIAPSRKAEFLELKNKKIKIDYSHYEAKLKIEKYYFLENKK